MLIRHLYYRFNAVKVKCYYETFFKKIFFVHIYVNEMQRDEAKGNYRITTQIFSCCRLCVYVCVKAFMLV